MLSPPFALELVSRILLVATSISSESSNATPPHDLHTASALYFVTTTVGTRSVVIGGSKQSVSVNDAHLALARVSIVRVVSSTVSLLYQQHITFIKLTRLYSRLDPHREAHRSCYICENLREVCR